MAVAIVLGATGSILIYRVGPLHFLRWAGLGGQLVANRTSNDAESQWAIILEAVEQQRWPEVERLLRDRIQVLPDEGKSRVMLGHLLANTGRTSQAEPILEAVPRSDSAWMNARLILASIAFNRLEAPQAIKLYSEVADQVPEAVEPRQRLIYLLSLELRTEEARERLWELYQTKNDPRILIDLVLEATKSEVDVRAAGPELTRYFQKSPNDPFLNRAYGLSELWGGRAESALPSLAIAARTITNDPLGRLGLAEALLQLDRPVEVPRILGTCPTDRVSAAHWWLSRARLETLQGSDLEALTSLRTSIALAPEIAETHHRLARALSRLGDEEEAGQVLERAESIREQWNALQKRVDSIRKRGFEKDPNLYQELGLACANLGLQREARAWLELALSLNPVKPEFAQSLTDLNDRFDELNQEVQRSFPQIQDVDEIESSITEPSELEIAVSGQETTVRDASGVQILFDDRATALGVLYRYDHGPRDDLYLADTMGGGVGLIDYDQDGWIDIYFVNGCPTPYDPANPPRPNRLYRNQGGDSFLDVTESANVAGAGYGMGVTVGDYDADGFPDLFVTGVGRTILYRNRGDGTFDDVTERAGVFSDRWTTAAGFADLDQDQDLDLVVVTYVGGDPLGSRGCKDYSGAPIHCSPSEYPAQQDLLFRNNGNGTFTEVGETSGIHAPSGRGLGLALADFNDDNQIDIYVANDASADFLFLNLGGLQFQESALMSGLALDGSGKATASMGVVADDLNGNGLIDLLHTNFLNEPNTLHQNLGNGQFLDSSTSAGLGSSSLSVTGFGAAGADFDLDGDLDLFVTNGHVDHQPDVNSPMAQPPQLFQALGGGRFTPLSRRSFPYLTRELVGRGLAAGDLNHDGRVDLVVIHRNRPVSILMNRTEGGHWLGLNLRDRNGVSPPVGTKVVVRSGGQVQSRFLTSGTSYLSSHDPRIWIGLNGSTLVDRLDVYWTSGLVQSVEQLQVDYLYRLIEGEAPEIESPIGIEDP